MASLKRDVGRIHPELKDTVGLFDNITYRWNYSEVFDDMLDYMVRQHLILPTEASVEAEQRFQKKYSTEEQDKFVQIYQNLVVLTRDRVNLWMQPENRTCNGWYDPLGSFYEEVSSDGKKSAMGQFFTPPHVVTMMTQITLGNDVGQKMERGEPITMAEPACGSGRFVLAANALYPGTFSCANDLDYMCAKMTAINMCLNGAVGQVTCGDGLDIRGESFRFGWEVQPMIHTLRNVKCNDTAKQPLFDATWMMLSATNPNISKVYCLVPLKKEDCMIYASDFPRNFRPESTHGATSLKDRLDQLDFLTGEK